MENRKKSGCGLEGFRGQFLGDPEFCQPDFEHVPGHHERSLCGAIQKALGMFERVFDVQRCGGSGCTG